jgi:hypothetical protein
VVRASVARYGQDLRAIILTGSVARNEGTFVREGESWRALGDAECILILHKHARFPDTPLAALLLREIEDALASRGILCHVDFSMVRSDFLRRLRPHIFAYELRACGQVVWGDPRILALIPPFDASQIPLEDAWRLLQNRIVETLGIPHSLPSESGQIPEGLYYRTVKLYLDMATSLLVFRGAYAPTYGEREQRLRTLKPSAGAGDPPFEMGGFIEQVAACTEWKLHPVTPTPSGGPEFWRTALRYAHQLWRWELAQLAGLDHRASDHDLFCRWMRLQPYPQRLRGWAHALRHQGWLRSWREWGRWSRLALTASPRYWTYAAANDLLFGQASLLETSGKRSAANRDWRTLKNCLPLRKPSTAARLNWSGIAAEISWNYTELLMGTRA